MNFVGQGGGGTATPFQRVVDPAQMGLYLDLEQSELMRIKRYAEQWRFYIGQHWRFTREDGEPLVTLNYTRAIIDKGVAWLVGKGMSISVPDVLKKKTLPALWEVWKYNNYKQMLYNIATLGAVTGDVFILVTYAAATDQAKRVNPHTKGQIRIQLLNSEQVFPEWDPMDVNVLLSVRIETVFQQKRTSEGNSQARSELHTRRFTQIITRDEITEQYQGQDAVKKPNPLGEIPLIHIKNQAVPGEYYGLSDMDCLVDLNRELNEKSTDMSDTINYHAAPTTVIQGAKVKNLERSAKNIWSGLPETAKVFNLELQGDLGASLQYFDRVKSAMMEISSTPEGSLGGGQHISNTSGVALATAYGPLVEKTDRKKASYEPALEEVNYFVLRTMETVRPDFRLPMDLCVHCGGRIVEFQEANGSTRRKCYRIDPQTFDFQDPMDVPIKFVRQFSFGKRIEEIPFRQAMAESGIVGASFWDVIDPITVEQKAADDAAKDPPQIDPATGMEMPPAEPQTPETPQIASEAIELPKEPENITLRRRVVDTAGNELEANESEVLVVPTGCEDPEYLNPYETATVFNDTVPKDKQLQLTLFQGYDQLHLVSKKWMRKQIPEIEDPVAMALEIEEEQGANVETPGTMPPELMSPEDQKKLGSPNDPYTRTMGPPFGSNLPSSG